MPWHSGNCASSYPLQWKDTFWYNNGCPHMDLPRARRGPFFRKNWSQDMEENKVNGWYFLVSRSNTVRRLRVGNPNSFLFGGLKYKLYPMYCSLLWRIQEFLTCFIIFVLFHSVDGIHGVKNQGNVWTVIPLLQLCFVMRQI